jgi:hypothetical protein
MRTACREEKFYTILDELLNDPEEGSTRKRSLRRGKTAIWEEH